MQHAVLGRSAIDSLFSSASHWPSYSDLDRMAWDTTKHLIEQPKTGQLMVLVATGSPFEMVMPAFYVGVHPVTNAQYARFVAETSHRPPDNRIWQEPGKMHHPVVCVDWDDATAYCHWAGLRLPTELEWEKAARGVIGRAYPWGNKWDPNRCRNYLNKGSETTADVWGYGQGGSPFGGLQLSGNVWEWCASSSGQSPAVRGGSWCSDGSHFFSVSNSRNESPVFRGDYFGFRCVTGLGNSP